MKDSTRKFSSIVLYIYLVYHNLRFPLFYLLLLVEFNFGKNEVLYPEQNLFLWALFLNRIEIAMIFWQIGEHQICSALFACNLLKSMSYRLSDLEKELQKYAK